MKDICIKLNCDVQWGHRSHMDTLKIDRYKEWITKNLKKGTYYFPRTDYDRIYFLNQEELTLFTLVHGKVYEIVGPGPIDMINVNRMIWNATIMERYENDKNA